MNDEQKEISAALETIRDNQTEILKTLDTLKNFPSVDFKYIDEIRKRQLELFFDLEEMVKNESKIR